MQPRALLIGFGLSLAANAALGYFVWRRVEPDRRAMATRDVHAPKMDHAMPAATQPALRQLGERVSAARSVDDFRELADTLRAAGWSSDATTQMIRALVAQEFERRRRKVFDESKEPYWRATQLTQEQLAALRAMEREQRDFLLGINLPRTEAEIAAFRRRYGNISDTKITHLEKLFRDYNDLRQELRLSQRKADGALSREDSEAQNQLLNTEIERDIAALLTPEEKAEYDFRRSPELDYLRTRLGSIEVNEEEFRALYVAQKAFRATQPPGASLEPENANQLAAWSAWQEQVRATLGDERYRLLAAAQLAPSAPQFLAERPAITAAQVQALARLQRTAPFELQKEMLAPNLTGDERRARVETVNQRFHAQLTEILGPQYAAEALAKKVLRFLPGGG